MIVNPHPVVVTTIAKQRRAELRAQAERDRLARLAQANAEGRSRWPDLFTVVGIVLALALPFVVSRQG